MTLDLILSLCTPITWLVAMMGICAWSRIFQSAKKKREHRSRIVRVGPSSPEAMGAALMFLSMAYRPNHAFVAKAQIVEEEEADDDEQGGPDTSQRHLMRQLRRIRQGDKLDRLILRLE